MHPKSTNPYQRKRRLAKICQHLLTLGEQFLWISIIFPNRIYFFVLRLYCNRANTENEALTTSMIWPTEVIL